MIVMTDIALDPFSSYGHDGIVENGEIVNEKTLREIAREGEGAFFRATDNQTLATIFGQINQMEKAKIKSDTLQDVRDYYYIYIYWAIVWMLFTLFLKNTALGNILED